MNTEERAEAAFRAAIRECAGVCHGDMEKAFAIIAAAIREERERCAKVAETGPFPPRTKMVDGRLYRLFAANPLEDIATAIRSQP